MTDGDLAQLTRDGSARVAVEVGAVVRIVRPLAADLLATLCFYIAFAATGDVALATAAAIGLGVAQIAWAYARFRAVPALQWASLLLVIVVGALSFATGDPRYLLYKASIAYLVVGAAMFRRGWLNRYLPPIALQLLPPATIAGFGRAWALLLIGTGLLALLLVLLVPARTVALVMGIWAPASKIALLAAQYAVGRAIVRRRVIAARLGEDAASSPADGLPT